MALVKVAQKGGVAVLADTVVDVQSKVFDFDADIAPLLPGVGAAQLAGMFVVYTSDATSGQRNVLLEVLDASSNTVFRAVSALSILTAGTTKSLSFWNKGFEGNEIIATFGSASAHYQVPFPQDLLFLCSGLKLRVAAFALTTGGIVGAGDDLIVHLHLKALYGTI